jgi:hypothetical protein
MMRYVFHGAGT